MKLTNFYPPSNPGYKPHMEYSTTGGIVVLIDTHEAAHSPPRLAIVSSMI